MSRHVHLLKIKRYQNIHNAHIAPDMSALSFHYHIHHIFAEFIGQRRQLFYLIHSPVSYTHLDVYKRQPEDIIRIHIRFPMSGVTSAADRFPEASEHLFPTDISPAMLDIPFIVCKKCEKRKNDEISGQFSENGAKFSVEV